MGALLPDGNQDSDTRRPSPTSDTRAEDKGDPELLRVTRASSDADRSRSSDGKATSQTGISTPPPTSDQVGKASPRDQVSDDHGELKGNGVSISVDRGAQTKSEPFPELDDQMDLDAAPIQIGAQPATPASANPQDSAGDAQSDFFGDVKKTDVESATGINEAAFGQSRADSIASRRAGSEQRQTGLVNPQAGDAVFAPKAPMRIDTGVARNRPSTDFSASVSSLTPLRSAQAAMQSSPPERMTTRVSSGALRHKSVSEILGETPKSGTAPSTANASHDTHRDDFTPGFRRGSIVASPDSATPRARPSETKDRDKERSKLSAVVFALQKGFEGPRPGNAQSALRKTKADEEKDYLVPLFAAQATAQNPTLNHLLSTSHKTLTTANHYIDYHESQDCRILKRIYHLQNSNRWSLRQLERSAEPARPTTIWDALLGEVKWMRTDFREERKWKLVAARNLALWCAEWVASPADERASLQVKVRPILGRPESKSGSHLAPDTPRNDGIDHENTPELVETMEGDVSEPSDDGLHSDFAKTPPPAALFSLGPENISFHLDKTPMSDKLLAELPQYQPYYRQQESRQSLGALIDSAWQKPIVPVSKLALGKVVIRDPGSRRIKSRYEYALEEEPDEDGIPNSHSFSHTNKPSLLPEQNDVALFSPSNSHIITRLHATHAFRPPSQHPMPTQQFFEFRSPSQWTLAEDDELRRLVREYEYNWHLISDCMSQPSLFTSGAERRTPWECFERWESFEGLPGDMDKHSYFRAWRQRRGTAKAHLEQRFLLQQQSAGGAQIARRRSAEPMHVEKRRNDKPVALLTAIAKVVKRRETVIQKQQHCA